MPSCERKCKQLRNFSKLNDSKCMFIRTKKKCFRKRNCRECFASKNNCAIHKITGECWSLDLYADMHKGRNVSEDLFLNDHQKYCKHPSCLGNLNFCRNCFNVREGHPEYLNSTFASSKKYSHSNTGNRTNNELIAFSLFCGLILLFLTWVYIRCVIKECSKSILPIWRKYFHRKANRIDEVVVINLQLDLAAWRRNQDNNLLIFEKEKVTNIMQRQTSNLDEQLQVNDLSLVFLGDNPHIDETPSDLRNTWHSRGSYSL